MTIIPSIGDRTEDEKLIEEEIRLISFHLPPPTLGDSICTDVQKQARQMDEALRDVLENGTDEDKRGLASMISKRRIGI